MTFKGKSMKAFATICFGLLVSSACVAGGTVDGLVDILHRRKLEQLRKIRKVEVVNELIEIAERAYFSAAIFFDTIDEEEDPGTKSEKYKIACRNFVEGNPHLFWEEKMFARVLFATALFATIIGNDKQAAALIFAPGSHADRVASEMYVSIGDNWLARLIGHSPFEYGKRNGFRHLAEKNKNTVEEVALDMDKVNTKFFVGLVLKDVREWKMGWGLWSPEIRTALEHFKKQNNSSFDS